MARKIHVRHPYNTLMSFKQKCQPHPSDQNDIKIDLPIRVSALRFLQCIDTAAWLTRRTAGR